MFRFIGIDKKSNSLWLSYASSILQRTKERRMYNFEAVISSIGGGIGIFLGYSCFGVLSNGLKHLYKKYLETKIQDYETDQINETQN